MTHSRPSFGTTGFNFTIFMASPPPTAASGSQGLSSSEIELLIWLSLTMKRPKTQIPEAAK